MTCLLDTGSMATTVTEDFFRKNLQDKCDMMNSSFYCLKAANGIDSRAKFVRSADDRTLLPANSVTTVMTTGGPTLSLIHI